MGSISNKDLRSQPIHKIVAIGDSITYGMSASAPERRWVEIAARHLEMYQGAPVSLEIRGLCGNILCVDTPAYPQAAKPAGLERLQTDVIDRNPDLIIVAYGLNDSRGGTPIGTFVRDYQIFIDRIRAALPSAIIVVLNLFYMHEQFYSSCEGWNHSNYRITEAYNLAIQALAQTNELILADVYSCVKGVDWAVANDHCHPNDLGHLLIGNKVFEAIARSCSFTARVLAED